MATEITVPQLGESVTEATVAQWLKKEGDAVAQDEAVVELETDKVTQEIYAAQAGVLSEIKVAEGETVEIGAVLGVIDAAGAAKPAAKKEAKAEKKAEKKPEPQKAEPKKAEAPQAPSVRRIAAETGIDPERVEGTGKAGRVTKGDMLAAATAKPARPHIEPPPPASERAIPTPAHEGPREERVRMSRLRQRIAERLKEAQDTAAILTTFNEVDMSNLLALRARHKDGFEKKHGVKLGFMGFFVKAAIRALKDFPAVNAEISGTDIIYKNHYDIGVAVSTESGLMVPVIRDADQLGFAGIEGAINDYAARAREGRIAIEDLTGGTFTISNGGVFGSLLSTPILNPPQSGILGMHKTQDRPVAINGKVEIRPMMYLALSYDHRIIDGREAVSFLVRVKDCIEDPERLLLDV